VLDQQTFAGETCAHLLAVQDMERRMNCNGSDNLTDGRALKMLLSRGISLYTKNNYGETPIDYIVKCHNTHNELRRVLFDHTHQCLMTFLMGTHSRLGSASLVRNLPDIVLDLVLLEKQKLIESALLNAYNSLYDTPS